MVEADRSGGQILRGGHNLPLHLDGQFVRLARELHRPRHGGRTPVEFAIDEIGQPSEAQPERSADHEVVAQPRPVDLVPPGIPKSVKHHPENPAVGRHAALPDADEQKRITHKAVEIVKKHVTQPSAEQHAEDGATGDKIAHLIRGNDGKTALREVAINEERSRERRQVGQAIPTDAKALANLHRERIKTVNPVGEHQES